MKGKGFSGMTFHRSGPSAELQQMRENLLDDFERRLKKQEKKDKKKQRQETNSWQQFSTFEAWGNLNGVRQNSENRLSGWSQFVQTTGKDAGKIVVPTTYTPQVAEMLAKLIEGQFNLEVDFQNAVGALMSIDLWTVLAGKIGDNNFTDSMFGQIYMFKMLAGHGLVRQSMFPSLPGVPAGFGTILPYIRSLSIAVAAS